MQVTIFTANCVGQAGNCSYPNKVTVVKPELLQEAVKKDHVCGAFKGNYRTSTMSDMPGSPNRNIHKMEDAIVKIIALEDEINSDIHELISLKADITHMIKRVSNRAERTILEKRYLCFDTWEQISVDMGYSIQHTFRLHDKALKEIDGFLKVEN